MAAGKTVSKNNPDARSQQKLVVFCPETDTPMIIIKMIPGGMVYRSEKTGKSYPIYEKSYQNFRFEWVKK